MELKGLLLFISMVLLSFQVVYADAEGIGMLEVPEGTVETVDTQIEATIENWGYDKIFVALPEGWTIDLLRTGPVKSFPVREKGLWRVFGVPAYLGYGNPQIFTGRGYETGYMPFKPSTTIGTREGWWLRPNEGINIDIYVSDIDPNGGVIDPQKIEKENPSIRVIKWYESFTLELEEPGFITAPWTVEGAALVESTAAPHSTEGNEGQVYYDRYQKEVAVAEAPAWDEWFELKNSLVYMMTDTRLAPIDLELPSLEESDMVVTVKPVWRVDTIADIVYAYEWKSYQKVKGMTIGSDAAALDFPEWFELF